MPARCVRSLFLSASRRQFARTGGPRYALSLEICRFSIARPSPQPAANPRTNIASASQVGPSSANNQPPCFPPRTHARSVVASTKLGTKAPSGCLPTVSLAGADSYREDALTTSTVTVRSTVCGSPSTARRTPGNGTFSHCRFAAVHAAVFVQLVPGSRAISKSDALVRRSSPSLCWCIRARWCAACMRVRPVLSLTPSPTALTS